MAGNKVLRAIAALGLVVMGVALVTAISGGFGNDESTGFASAGLGLALILFTETFDYAQELVRTGQVIRALSFAGAFLVLMGGVVITAMHQNSTSIFIGVVILILGVACGVVLMRRRKSAPRGTE